MLDQFAWVSAVNQTGSAYVITHPAGDLQVLMTLTVTRPSVINAAPKIRAAVDSTAKIMESPPTNTIEVMASNFTRQDMQRFSSQLLIIGPNVLLASIQRCHFSEERAKQAAASNTNGVVGSNGRKIPTMAIARNRKPNP